MQFDTFDNLNELIPQPFKYIPNRFELWQNQKITRSGLTNGLIETTIKNGKIFIIVNDINLHYLIDEQTEYDKLVCATDRLRIINVPAKTDISCNGIDTLSSIYGPTRSIKIFKETEPYCCNIFLKDGKLAKLSFSYSNPVKLLEFYSQAENESFKKNQIDESNYLNLVSLSNTVLTENFKTFLFSKLNDFSKEISEKITSKFSNNLIRQNLIQWQDDEFMNYVSFSMEIGVVSFIIKNNLLSQLKNSTNLNIVVSFINFNLGSFLSNIFFELGLKNDSSLFYTVDELSTLADRSYNLLYDKEIEEKIDFLINYYLE